MGSRNCFAVENRRAVSLAIGILLAAYAVASASAADSNGVLEGARTRLRPNVVDRPVRGRFKSRSIKAPCRRERIRP
jgi:hypothetical protein